MAESLSGVEVAAFSLSDAEKREAGGSGDR